MSILIKMEMPKNCGECPIYEHLHIHGNTFRFCRLTKMETNPTEKRADCPLISIPPHGRLIDADALLEEEARKTEAGFLGCVDIESAPTIIEAEDSVKRAKWEKHNDSIMYWWECSQCHTVDYYIEEDLTNYCPHCGAKMEFIEAEVDDDFEGDGDVYYGNETGEF